MKPHKQNFNVHMVRNSRPVGKVFKKKKIVKDGVTGNSSNFKFGGFGKSDLKKNIDSRTEGKVKFVKDISNNSLIVSKNSNGISKKTKEQTEKVDKSSLPPRKDDDTKIEKTNTLPVLKRKFDGVDTTSPNQKKIEKRTKSDLKIKKTSGDAIINGESKPTVDSVAKPRKKWHRKKKKKKAPESGDVADTQYKPVWVVKKPQDFSANWKNLKEGIIQNDKEQAAKLRENESKQEKGKYQKGKISDKKQNIKEKGMNLKEMMEEQEKQSAAYIEQKKKQSAAYEEQKKKQSVKTEEPKKKKKKKDDIWFDNVDPILLGEDYDDDEEDDESAEADSQQVQTDKPETEKSTEGGSEEGESKAVAIDCEMVGVGLNGKESVLARVSIVNQYCRVIYDKYVKPREAVVDYRTEFSGIRPEDLKDAHNFKEVQAEVAKILSGKILVGHGLDNDLRVLFIQHPRSRIRDTSRYKPFKTMFRGHTPKLKILTRKILGVDIQTGEHDSVQDSQAVMRIYTVHKREWDKAKRKVFEKPSKKKSKEDKPPNE